VAPAAEPSSLLLLYVRTGAFVSHFFLRFSFFYAVADHFPTVLEALRRDVLPHFSGLFEIRPNPRMQLHPGGYGTTFGVPPDYHAGPPEQYIMVRTTKEAIKRNIDDPAASLLRHSWSREFARAVDPKRIAVRDRLARWSKICRPVGPRVAGDGRLRMASGAVLEIAGLRCAAAVQAGAVQVASQPPLGNRRERCAPGAYDPRRMVV